MLRSKTIYYEVEVPKDLKAFQGWEFSSGGSTGEDFIVFAKEFKKFIKENLPDQAVLVDFSRGHYILSGFISRAGKFVYFSISDVRHFPGSWIDDILIRTAQHDKDYTGGSNGSASLTSFSKDVERLLN